MRKKKDVSPQLNAAIMEVVDNQLKSGEPAITRETYERLIAEGHAEESARNLIAVVVTIEIYDVLKNYEPFDLERFSAALRKLPETFSD